MLDLSYLTTDNDILIDVQDLGIHFQRTISSHRNGIKNSFTGIIKLLLSRERKERFWALRHISFTLRRGEVIGIVGPNGAGKSTLLKILAQVLIPDEGTVKLNGKISSLLALGSGFIPNLNGRENIYLNGMYMGMTRDEISEVYEDIVSFSGLIKFIETPIKYYSNGMKARLGFSVAVHTKPEILIIDEVLGAGDKQFQDKAKEKMADFLITARGIVIVSHNKQQIGEISSKCLWIDGGRKKQFGPSNDVLAAY